MPIYKQPNGGYLVKVSYKDQSGKYRKLTRMNESTRTRAGALKVEAQLITELSKSPSEKLAEKESKILNEMTFADLAEDYMNTLGHERRNSTLRQKQMAFRCYLIPYFGNIRINDFTPSIIQSWKHKMDKVKSEKTNRPLTVSYKNTVLKAFISCLNYAMKFYGYTNLAYKRIGRFTDTFSFEKDKDIHYWTYDQFKRFSESLRERCVETEKRGDAEFLRWWGRYVFFNILFYCGLRKGETHPLLWTDIKAKNGYYAFSITKSLSQKTRDSSGEYDLTPPKNKSSVREVPICQKLLEILTAHYERYTKVWGFDPKNNIWMICGGLMPLSDTALDNIKNEISKELKLPQIRIHDFRHSFVSLMINADVNIKIISKLVGHSTVDQTWNTYGHLYPDSENTAIQLLDKLA